MAAKLIAERVDMNGDVSFLVQEDEACATIKRVSIDS
jgi:hypothetical protein